VSVTGWWLLKDHTNGSILAMQASSPSTTQTPVVGSSQRKLAGAGAKDYFTATWLGSDPNASGFGAALQNALGKHGATAAQLSSITQAFDAGAIMQGAKAVAAPITQQPGQTDPAAGQRPSASEAVPAGINLGIPGLSGIEAFIVRVLKGLVGIALIALGLQALTGRGDGNPVTAVRSAGVAAAKVVR
jgi:hypothetical protein